MRCERGYTKQLPDLAVWLKRSGPPVALISESGGRREDRQKKILEGWRDAVCAGQYSAVLYDCANDSVAHWISRLAEKVRLTRSEFGVVIQARAEEIRTLAPAADDPDESLRSSSDTNMPSSSEDRDRTHSNTRPSCADPGSASCGAAGSRTLRRLRRLRSGSVATARSSEFLSLDRADDGAGLASPCAGW